MADAKMARSQGAFRAQQIALRYEPREDRLILTLSGGGEGVRRFWMTRRLTLGLMGIVTSEAGRLADGVATTRPRTRAGGLATVEEHGAGPAGARAPATPGDAHLVMRVHVRRLKGSCAVLLEPDGVPGAVVAFDAGGVARFRELLTTLSRRARWLVDPVVPNGLQSTPVPRPKRRLH